MDYKRQYLNAVEWQEASRDRGARHRSLSDQHFNNAIHHLTNALHASSARGKSRFLRTAMEHLCAAQHLLTLAADMDAIGPNPLLVKPDEDDKEEDVPALPDAEYAGDDEPEDEEPDEVEAEPEMTVKFRIVKNRERPLPQGWKIEIPGEAQ